MSQAPEWLPDWRNETSYNFPQRNSWRLWSWEFLRRNPEYQKAWREHYVDGPLKWVVELVHNAEARSPEEMAAFVGEKNERFELNVCDPPALPGETREQWLARIGEGNETPLAVHLAKQFGLFSGNLCDPSINTPPVWWVSFDSSAGPAYLDWFPGCPESVLGMRPEAPEDFVVRFNLNRSLAMQWKRIKRSMEYQRKKLSEEGLISPENPRTHGSNFPSYLRVLDAKTSGASVPDMASVIYSHLPNDYPECQAKQTVRNHLSAAEKLRDSDYRVLCFKSW